MEKHSDSLDEILVDVGMKWLSVTSSVVLDQSTAFYIQNFKVWMMKVGFSPNEFIFWQQHSHVMFCAILQEVCYDTR